MRAYVLDRHGPPSVLRPTELPTPAPGPGQVRVRIQAIGINYAEIMSRKGIYRWAPPLPYVLGLEATGVIDGLGEGVARELGEPVVIGMKNGAYATAAVVDERAALPAIAGFTLEENAAFTVNYMTAWAGLVESARARAGDRVLITAAGGGVGTAAVQIASRLGCSVIAAAGSREKLARVERLGAGAIVNYRSEGWEESLSDLTASAPIDIALEMVGGEVFRAARAGLGPFGLIVVVGYAGMDFKLWKPWTVWRTWRGRPTMALVEMIDRSIGMTGCHLGRLLDHQDEVGRIWSDLVGFVSEHGIRPQVGHVLSFDEAAAAHRLIESRESYGKVVLRVD
jgi:NADPH:quinone reductase-like Zn-dependent oxidoreductase